MHFKQADSLFEGTLLLAQPHASLSSNRAGRQACVAEGGTASGQEQQSESSEQLDDNQVREGEGERENEGAKRRFCQFIASIFPSSLSLTMIARSCPFFAYALDRSSALSPLPSSPLESR